ncbi:MAG: MmgE/PrpD family protein [Chloroflexota bacterium]|nr:MmgE/PrpD family protein [Chloroflexota bacterium]
MKGTTEQLVNFVVETGYEDLPPAVVHEAKRILLDSIGCGIAGIMSDKGKAAVKVARRLGGAPEATILGMGEKVSVTSAALANGELINALDYDVILLPSHVVLYVLPAALALAEANCASGRDLILATAIAHEVSTRVAGGMMLAVREVTTEGPQKGQVQVKPGYGNAILGGTAGAGKVLDLDKKQMANALGIAVQMYPVPVQGWEKTLPAPMTKYLTPAWMGPAEITAAMMAQEGFTGNPAILDGEEGFWSYLSPGKWDPSRVVDRLGERWRIMGTFYKVYPCCGVIHSALCAFTTLRDRHQLKPESIKAMRVWFDPGLTEPIHYSQALDTQTEMQFSIPYVFAVAAHGIAPGPDWHDRKTVQDPRIRELMKKITFAPHPDYAQALAKDGRANPSRVEVDVDGQTLREERDYPRGVRHREGEIIGDDELIEKFRNNTSRHLPWDRIDRAMDALWNLEKVECVEELMQLVSL